MRFLGEDVEENKAFSGMTVNLGGVNWTKGLFGQMEDGCHKFSRNDMGQASEL